MTQPLRLTGARMRLPCNCVNNNKKKKTTHKHAAYLEYSVLSLGVYLRGEGK